MTTGPAHQHVLPRSMRTVAGLVVLICLSFLGGCSGCQPRIPVVSDVVDKATGKTKVENELRKMRQKQLAPFYYVGAITCLAGVAVLLIWKDIALGFSAIATGMGIGLLMWLVQESMEALRWPIVIGGAIAAGGSAVLFLWWAYNRWIKKKNGNGKPAPIEVMAGESK